MQSPFPGMDPYLEDPAFWPDFHNRFINALCETISDGLPEPYDALLDESVNLVTMSPEVIKLVYPDIAVTQHGRSARTKSKSAGTLMLEPVKIPHRIVEETRQTRVEVIHRP